MITELFTGFPAFYENEIPRDFPDYISLTKTTNFHEKYCSFNEDARKSRGGSSTANWRFV